MQRSNELKSPKDLSSKVAATQFFFQNVNVAATKVQKIRFSSDIRVNL